MAKDMDNPDDRRELEYRDGEVVPVEDLDERAEDVLDGETVPFDEHERDESDEDA